MQTEVLTQGLTESQLEVAASMLKAVAHPIRLSILQLLQQNEKMSVNDICEMVGSEQSLTSHHLSNMKLKGILGCRREGQKIYYYIRLKEIASLLTCLEECTAHLS